MILKHVTAKKTAKKYQNLARKIPYQRPDKKVEEDIDSLKQVPVSPWDRFVRNVRNQFDDLETFDYNNDTNISDLDTKNKSGTQIPAKKIIKNTKHWQEKDPTKTFVFAKQVPVHPSDRLARKTKDEVKFIKQVLLHLRERFKGKRKIELDNYSQLSKKRKNNDEVTSIKQAPIHPHPHPHPQKLAALNGKVLFVKQVPVHRHDRLKQLKNKP